MQDLKDTAAGEDDIHNQMLQDLPCSSKHLLLDLFNNIWKGEPYPEAWKTSKIIPLLKPNKDKYQIKSYRPVALTSCLGKLMERMVNARLSWMLHKNNIFHHTQCGFRPKTGTIDALLQLTEECHESLHQTKYTVIVFLDLEGAFDKVWWEGLILKAASAGIVGNMLRWIKSFLSDRYIKVQVGNATSNKSQINSGTPQGSVISPVIFNIMMYDLPGVIPQGCKEVTFADDRTIYASTQRWQWLKDGQTNGS